MSDILVLKARIRKRDKDIQQAISNLKLEEGEMADMVRDGFRMRLAEMEALRTRDRLVDTIALDAARLVAKELMNNLKEGSR
jgi:hypothetical protein